MQDTREITFYPGLDLSDVGKTPTGQPLFRVVLATTRIDKVYTTHGFEQVPMYLHDGWMLEKWLAPADFGAGTPEEWQALLKQVGFRKPYPSDGEYDAIHPFGSNEEVQLAPLYARMAQFGKEHLTLAQRKQIIDWHQAQEEKRVATERREIIAEAAPSRFGRVAERVQLYDNDGRTIQL